MSRCLIGLILSTLAALATAGCLKATDDYARLGELCNGVDDDLDGLVDEEPDGTICPDFANNPGSGARLCREGQCVIERCNAGRVDLDGGHFGDRSGYRNGCESVCTPTRDAIDVCVGGEADCLDNCDGQDDDCDGVVDEGQTHPLSRLPGVCADHTLVCDGGWREPEHGQLQSADYEPEETRCDGLDNDCDRRTDEGHPDDGCDGVDDDCDGRVDEGGACAETICAAGTQTPPCNGCPAGTVIPAPDPVGGEWVCVPAGEFWLGSPESEQERVADEGPPVPVAITRPLLVQTHEVTARQWRAAFGYTPAGTAGCDDCPIRAISWFSAVAYLNHLSADDLQHCYTLVDCDGWPSQSLRCDPAVTRDPVDCAGYRLPSEAEWEYFARGGTRTRFWSGDAESDLARVEWYGDHAGFRPHSVCGPPEGPVRHPWGLCDVHGNVREWTESWYGAYPDPPDDGTPRPDPRGPPWGRERVVRSGSSPSIARFVRAARRRHRSPDSLSDKLGFRPVRLAGPAPQAR